MTVTATGPVILSGTWRKPRNIITASSRNPNIALVDTDCKLIAPCQWLTGAIRYARHVMMTRERAFEYAGYPGLGTVFFALLVVEIILLDTPALFGETRLNLVLAVATVLLSLAMVGRLRYPRSTEFQIVNVALCSLGVIHRFASAGSLGTLVLVAVVGCAPAGLLIPRSRS